jgi:hypothetical protein
LWRRRIGSTNPLGFASSPAIAGELVAVGSYQSDGTGTLSVFNLSDGSEEANFPLPFGAVSSPAISGRRIFVGDLGGNLYAFAAPLDPGDANADGKVDVRDAILLLRASVGLESLSERQTDAGDLVPSGPTEEPKNRINALDVVAVLRKAIGL